MTAPTKEFPHQPFDPIAHHRVAHLRADGNTQSRFALVVGFADNQKICGVNFPAGARDSQEFGAFPQAGDFRKILGAGIGE